MLDQSIRKGRITGTAIGAIAGLNPYRTPLDIWLELTGRAQPFQGNEATAWGQALEQPIAERYARDEGVTLETCTTLVHPTHPEICGTPDRLVREIPKGLEVKTANARQAHRWGEAGTDQIPEEYLAQCVCYMAITGRPHWDLAVLIGGSDYRVYRLQRDLELEEALIDTALRFYRDHVQTDTPPEIDGSDAASAWLASRFPRAGKNLLDSTPELDALAAELAQVRAGKEALEQREAITINRMKEQIGEAGGLKGSWGIVRWSERRLAPRTDWEAVARDLAPSAALVAKHTSEGRTVRAFITRFTKES